MDVRHFWHRSDSGSSAAVAASPLNANDCCFWRTQLCPLGHFDAVCAVMRNIVRMTSNEHSLLSFENRISNVSIFGKNSCRIFSVILRLDTSRQKSRAWLISLSRSDDDATAGAAAAAAAADTAASGGGGIAGPTDAATIPDSNSNYRST